MPTPKQSPLIGAHLSIAHGLDTALFDAQAIGATCVQIFTHSNRQWHFAPINTERVDAFKQAQKTTTILPIVHASYLVNIGSANTSIAHKSLIALLEELHACALLNIPYLIMHAGSNCHDSVDTCCAQIAHLIDQAFDLFDAQNTTGYVPMLLLETLAGQGRCVGDRFEHLAQIYSMCTHQKHLGFCLDTAHVFAAGYDLRSKAMYQKTWQQFDDIVGIKHLHVIHTNDSAKALGSHIDRHAHIGMGNIGAESFKLLMNDPRLVHIPKIVEIPDTEKRSYQEEIALLVSYINKKSDPKS